MKWSINGNYHLFEPRDETGIAASMLRQELILFDGILLDDHSIREFGDVSTISNIQE
jgi:hypothetical protein